MEDTRPDGSGVSETMERSGHSPGEGAYRRVLVALFAAGFATFAQLSDVQAVLPAMSSDLGIAPATAALTVSATTLGLAASVLPWSAVSDRFGRVTAMKVSILFSGLLGVLGPLVVDFSWFLVVRLLLGISLGALPAISMAYLAEEIDKSHVTATASIFLAGNTVGGLVGRLIAGPLSELVHWRLAVEAVSVSAVVSGIIFIALIPKPRGFIPLSSATERSPGPTLWQRVLGNLRDPVMRALYLQGALVMGLFAAVYNYVGFRLTGEPFNVPPELSSLVFVVFLCGTVATPIAGRFAERLGRVRVMLGGIVVVIVGIALTAVANLAAVIVGLALFTMGSFVAHTLASSWVGQRAVIGRAQATASYQLSYQLGASIIGWGAGLVFQAWGWEAVSVALIALALIAGGVAAAVLAIAQPAASPREKDLL